MKRAVAALSFAALVACSHASQQANTTAVATANPSPYPPGVVAPANWLGTVREGIYPADAGAQCCFLAGRSSLVLDNPPNAKLVVFSFYVPSVPPFAHQKERVSIALEDRQLGTAELSLGAQNIVFTIPPSVRGRTHLRATLAMSIAWVPRKIGLNADKRELSVMLLKVSYT